MPDVVRRLGVLLAAAVLLGGCTLAEDDEMSSDPTPPTATVTRTPAPRLPDALPVGDARLAPATTVWAQGSVLHEGTEQMDLAPRQVDAMVRGWSGFYLLDDGELLFTDLERVRDTGIDGVTDLGATPDGSRIRIVLDLPGARGAVHVYDARTGEEVEPTSAGEEETAPLKGRPQDALVEDMALRLLRQGPYAVSATADQPFEVLDSEDRLVPMTGAVPDRFVPAYFTDDGAVVGLSYVPEDPSTPAGVVRCDLKKRACADLGIPDEGSPVVFAVGRQGA